MPLRPARLADAVAVPWLEDLRVRTTHLSLLTGSPWAVSDPRTLEPAGNTYSRAAVIMRRSSRVLLNTNPLTWTGLQNSNISEISAWDAAFNGNLLFSVPINLLQYGDSRTGALTIGAEQWYFGLDL